jgi:hypothetical protein
VPSPSKSTASRNQTVGMNCGCPKAPAQEPRIMAGSTSPEAATRSAAMNSLLK